MNQKTIFMQQTKTMNPKIVLALQIVETDEKESGIKKYRRLKNEHYVVNCLISEFRDKYVFASKKYQKNYKQYETGKISWNDFKYTTEGIFRKELEDCDHYRIDFFFGIKRKLEKKIVRENTKKCASKAVSVIILFFLFLS